MFDLFDFENTTPSRNFGSNARGGVLEYVDHCFGTLRVPYLSLIFLLRYIVSSPLFLVIYGSELKVSSTIYDDLPCGHRSFLDLSNKLTRIPSVNQHVAQNVVWTRFSLLHAVVFQLSTA